jgi:hypothetical protein
LGTRRIPQPLAATALGVLRTAELIEAATGPQGGYFAPTWARSGDQACVWLTRRARGVAIVHPRSALVRDTLIAVLLAILAAVMAGG